MNKKQKKVHAELVQKSKALKYSPTGVYNESRIKNLEDGKFNTNIETREEQYCPSCTTETATESK